MTGNKVLNWSEGCPNNQSYCRKSHQYILNVDPYDECSAGIDACDENATCNDKLGCLEKLFCKKPNHRPPYQSLLVMNVCAMKATSVPEYLPMTALQARFGNVYFYYSLLMAHKLLVQNPDQGCEPGTTAAPTPPPNPCLGAKKYHKVLNAPIHTLIFRVVSIKEQVKYENIGFCASLCTAKGKFGSGYYSNITHRGSNITHRCVV